MKFLEVIFQQDIVTVKDMVLMLFLGIYDRKNKEAGIESTYSTYDYRTQADIVSAISKASQNTDKPTQGAVSKALRDLDGVILKYKNKHYQFGKIDGYYRLLDAAQYVELAKMELFRLDPFLEETVFYNNADIDTATKKPHLSTVFAFKVSTSDMEKTKSLFRTILGGSCFEIAVVDNLMVIFLNASATGFRQNSLWLREYFHDYNNRLRRKKQ